MPAASILGATGIHGRRELASGSRTIPAVADRASRHQPIRHSANATPEIITPQRRLRSVRINDTFFTPPHFQGLKGVIGAPEQDRFSVLAGAGYGKKDCAITTRLGSSASTSNSSRCAQAWGENSSLCSCELSLPQESQNQKQISAAAISPSRQVERQMPDASALPAFAHLKAGWQTALDPRRIHAPAVTERLPGGPLEARFQKNSR